MVKVILFILLSSIGTSQIMANEAGCSVNIPQVVTDLIPLEQRNVIGEATDSGKLRYCELHSVIDNSKQTVAYWVSEKFIAIKYIDYSTSRLSPNVVQKDFRSGEFRAVELAGDQLKLGYTQGKNRQRDIAFDETFKSENEKLIDSENSQVIDAGFDNYVRTQWNALLSGATVEFYFASPVHLRNIRLRARLDKAICGDAANEDFCFVVEPANGLLRLFAGELMLKYDASQRLVEFRGVSNIVTEEGESQKLDIRYRYF